MTTHKPIGTDMICSYSIDLIELVAERHCLVNQELEEVMRCRLSGQKLELSVNRSTPGDDDSQGNLMENDKTQNGTSSRLNLQ
jgi:hypothetical protein